MGNHEKVTLFFGSPFSIYGRYDLDEVEIISTGNPDIDRSIGESKLGYNPDVEVLWRETKRFPDGTCIQIGDDGRVDYLYGFGPNKLRVKRAMLREISRLQRRV